MKPFSKVVSSCVEHIVRVLMFVLAIAIFAMVLLVFWFVFANFTYRYGFNGTISYMLRTMDAWWQAVAAFFAELFDCLP